MVIAIPKLTSILIFYLILINVPDGAVVNNPPAMQVKQKMQVQSLGQVDAQEKEMATYSSTLVWEMPRTEEPDGRKGM